jgi:hypothetical protein
VPADPKPPTRPTRRFLDAGPAQVAAEGDPFRPLEPEIRIVQFGRVPGDADLARAGRLFADRPDVWLRVYPASSPDLGFLKHFRGLRRLDLEIFELGSLDGLFHVADTLEAFHFGPTRTQFSLRFLTGLPQLRDLYLGGHRKDIDVLGGLVALTRLSLRGVTLPDLTPLLPLQRLTGLAILLGGTADLRLLPRFPELEELGLLRITGLSDLAMLADLGALRSLTLDWLRNVTSLPSLAGLRRLDRVAMETMKGLTSLAPVAAAPALRQLEIVTMPQLKPADFACLVGHPALAVLRAYPGGRTVNAAIKQMFPGIAE